MAGAAKTRSSHPSGYRLAAISLAVIVVLGGVSAGVIEAISHVSGHQNPIVIGAASEDTSTSTTMTSSTSGTTAVPGTSGSTAITSVSTSEPGASTTSTVIAANTIEYRNTQYGFTVTLPESWKGFSIVDEQWQGFANQADGAASPPIYGPQLLIRHPKWTSSHPRQDIPIMVFTLAEWDQIQQTQLTVGAAPIPPSELGRNSTYVFALPARYNYAFPTGWQEVASILDGHPLQGIEPASTTSSTGPALSTTYEITGADSGKTYTYTVTSRFSVILDQNTYPAAKLVVTPSGIVGSISNIPSVAPPLYATRYQGVTPGTCTIRNGSFVVTVKIVQ